MATLNEIIQREVNPFDSVTFRTGNFWTENQQPSSATVESIHQEAIIQIRDTLQHVIRDRRTRSILLTGDSGCGKSYLLSRLKKNLNNRAFFAYIEPCLAQDYIWRHTLSHTVDGLMHIPEGEKESQLLLWLKGLSAYSDGGIKKRILGAKNHFIHELRSIYPTGIYQPKDFFTVLYELANPDLYFSACDWLRGYSISEDELELLGVSSMIDTEEAAKGVIANFGRISADNKPIALCFDQVELSPKSLDGSLDISSIFNVNTAFHNNNLKNFLVIISITQDQWRICQNTIFQSDLARIDREIILKQINLEQVKALWENRLYPIHFQAKPKPNSSIAPLDKQQLEVKYPGGKANLRYSLSFGGILYEKYKSTSSREIPGIGDKTQPTSDPLAAFKLLWQDELNKTKDKISHIRQSSSQELIEMLISAISVLGIQQIKPRFLNGKYSSYSFSYQPLNQSKQVGVLWNEDSNLKSFSYAMKACEKAISSNKNSTLIMIRAESLGKKNNQGYKIYQKIFNNSSNSHIKFSLESVHYLKTYQKLKNDAVSGDLVLNFKPLSLTDLEKLVRETKVLHQCSLLQDLEIVPTIPIIKLDPETGKELEVKKFLLNLVKHHLLLGQQTLIQQAKSQFTEIEEVKIERLIQELSQEQKISFVNPNAKPQERLICLIPQAVAGGKK
ncbi:ATP-binding protein [Pleurocapsa sp. FMAR1]|uniref:ATP-binding protein n=1 Tax=Pleurocapsa sp. FMAR1 TaxID=3040204 RepID=UPI0029C6EACB|nr:ATP-binding protein [Pleurocapsa sp. FMAR1]